MKFSTIALAAALACVTGCSDDDDGGQTPPSDSSTTASTGRGDSGSSGLVGSGDDTGTTTSTGSDSSTSSDASTDDESSTGGDTGLALWPQAYQDFIADVGGSKFVDLDGVQMHYIETGPTDGETVLLIHGIPTHSYLWRDVIPELQGKHVIAFDLIGFGRSERPDDLPYTPAMQVEFMQAFVEALALDDIHLVVHDLGGPVGLRWASEHPQRLRSISMFETLWTTLPGIDSVPPPFGELLAAMRLPDVGEDLVGRQNVFLAGLDGFTVGGVASEDKEVYEFPWDDPEDRIRVFLPSGPRAFPVPEDPVAFDFVDAYEQFLAQSPLPKLVLDADPGTLSVIEIPGPQGTDLRIADYAAEVFPNTTLADITDAGHFVQEDAPASLGQALDTFIDGAALK